MRAERILELVLAGDEAAQRELEGLAADPSGAEEARELARFVARCRALARSREVPPEVSGALARKVLARTTREDLSWSGDLRLVGRFVGSRLRSSLLLRVTAASLAIHLAALPVVAWVTLRRAADRPDFWTRIEPAPEEAFEPPAIEPRADEPRAEEPLDAQVLPPVDVTPEALLRAGVENALRLDRWCLASGGLPERSGPEPREPVLAELWRRSTGSGEEGPPEAWGSEDGPPRPEPREPLATAMAAERWLDLYARGEAGRNDVLARLPRPEVGSGPVARLVRAARARAQAYGILPPPAGFDPAEHSLCGRDPAVWRADLAAALAERGLDQEPAARAWITAR